MSSSHPWSPSLGVLGDVPWHVGSRERSDQLNSSSITSTAPKTQAQATFRAMCHNSVKRGFAQSFRVGNGFRPPCGRLACYSFGCLIDFFLSLLCLVRFGDLGEEEPRRHDGASSDGHLAHIFRHAAKELFNEDVAEVTYRTLRCVRTPTVCVCVCVCSVLPFRAGSPKPVSVGGAVLFIVFTPSRSKAFLCAKTF